MGDYFSGDEYYVTIQDDEPELSRLFTINEIGEWLKEKRRKGFKGRAIEWQPKFTIYVFDNKTSATEFKLRFG